jgi:hypothetical protein
MAQLEPDCTNTYYQDKLVLIKHSYSPLQQVKQVALAVERSM